MKHILLTGGAGFIGSNFVQYFLEKYKEYVIINLDLLTYAGNMENLANLKDNRRHIFIKGDICDKSLLDSIFKKYAICGIIHFAAESHVDNSIQNPALFTKTNVLGTQTLLDMAKTYWLDKPFKLKDGFKGARFHHISTDEVYGSLGEDGLFSEDSPYQPNSPYSASKAGSDMLVRAYNKTYGLNTIITNCSNNFGENQHDEKLIPTIIRNALFNKPIPIYGDGTNIRDWLYVKEHCKGIDLAFHKGKVGESYNIGGDCEMSNLALARKICKMLDTILPKDKSYQDNITFVNDRAGHDRRYAIDSTKIKSSLGFRLESSFDNNLAKTISFFINKYVNTQMGGGCRLLSILSCLLNFYKHAYNLLYSKLLFIYSILIHCILQAKLILLAQNFQLHFKGTS